ncbi:hypothetical protein SLS62_006052 [Diatrype stigma]|uniref:GST N-terminal domain-containing protein n=1 Tax=Diatrype stigma TaxID=117547 RepID=A0AAN9URS4_9PEZI
MSPTASSDPILFYDIASGPPIRPFAPNPWKTRYALNFKRANYATQWVDLSDVTATRKRLGASPVRFFSDGEPFYTLPAIEDPSAGGTVVVVGDSFDIAVYLDKKYPGDSGATNPRPRPRLFRDPATIGVYAAFNAHMDSLFTAAAPLCAQGMPFNPATAEACKAEFCRRAGAQNYDELVLRGEKRRELLRAFQTGASAEAARCFRFSSSPFVGGGEEPDYADLIVGGWLMFLSGTVPEWEEIRTWHGGLWGRLHEALEPYRGTW